MNRKKLIESLFSIIVGIGIFLFVFRNFNTSAFGSQIRLFDLRWLFLGFIINISSQLLRAIRWKKIFITMDLHPTIWTLFVSIITLGMTNQIIPRGGEVARILFIHKSEGIATAKVIGLTLAERLTDMVIMIIIIISLILFNIPFLNTLVDKAEVTIIKPNLAVIVIIITAIAIITGVAFYIIKNNKITLQAKVKVFVSDIIDGFKTLKQMDGKVVYILESLTIYFLWFLMSFVHFRAFPATSSLSMHEAIITFGFASLAFLVPVQGGIGAWHFVVIQIMLILGVSAVDAEVFAIVAHASMNTLLIPLGLCIIIIRKIHSLFLARLFHLP